MKKRGRRPVGRPPVSKQLVARILALRREGWGYKRIAHELGLGRTTVRRYIRDSGGGLFHRGKKERVLRRPKRDRGA